MATNTYTHGLEKIYQFEHVNKESVRPLARKENDVRPQTPRKNPSQNITKIDDDEQLVFEFGSHFSNGMTSLRLEEPISSLHLSPFAYKAIAHRGYTTIHDLIIFTMGDLKGFGQGHIDEIKEKLMVFVGKAPFQKKQTIDFGSFIRILFSEIEAKARFSFLDQYQLTSYFPLKPNELHEVEKWTFEQRRKIELETKEKIFKKYANYLKKKLHEITTIFLLGWLEKRCGLSTASELTERLFMLAEKGDEKEFVNISTLLNDLLSTSQLFEKTLVQVQENLYAKDALYADLMLQVIEKAKDYFYSPKVVYELEKLHALLLHFFAKQWQGFETGFIEKILRCSPTFLLSRKKSGTLVIHLDFRV